MQISIIKLSEIKKAKRFDAEYFKPEYLEIERMLDKFDNVKTIKDISITITNGHTPRYADLSIGEINFLTAEHLDDFTIQTENTKKIKKEASFGKLKRTILQKNDLLVTIKGKIGNFSVVWFDSDNKFNINQDVGLLRLYDRYNPYYIAGFLNSKFGKIQSKRVSTGQINPFLGLGNLSTLKIPILPQSFQLQIEKIVKEAHHKQSESKEAYRKAEQILLEELGLLDFKPQHKLFFETTKKAVEEAKRFDSEYFQPKYKEIIERIENYKGGFDKVENIFDFNNKNFFPKEDEFYNYIPLSKVSNNGAIEKGEKELGKDLPTRARRKVKTGEVILSSISGSLETSAMIQEEHNNFIVSNGFYVFSSEK